MLSSSQVLLRVRPLLPGILQIKGVQWTITSGSSSSTASDGDGSRGATTSGSSSSSEGHRSATSRCLFAVRAPTGKKGKAKQLPPHLRLNFHVIHVRGEMGLEGGGRGGGIAVQTSSMNPPQRASAPARQSVWLWFSLPGCLSKHATCYAEFRATDRSLSRRCMGADVIVADEVAPRQALVSFPFVSALQQRCSLHPCSHTTTLIPHLSSVICLSSSLVWSPLNGSNGCHDAIPLWCSTRATLYLYSLASAHGR